MLQPVHNNDCNLFTVMLRPIHSEIMYKKRTIRRSIQGDASALLRMDIRIFTTKTSDKQYFLNEKAVVPD